MGKSVTSRRSDPVRLIRAARELFLQYGFRRTSVDDVAQKAEIAKGTVYLAFKSKEELLQGVCKDLCEELLDAAQAATEGMSDPLARVRARLEAKYLRVHEIVHASPHSQELLQSKDAVAGEVVRQSELKFRRILAKDLELAEAARQTHFGSFKLDAAHAAELLMRLAASCSQPEHGNAQPTAALVRRRLQTTLDVALAGLQTPPH